jgi:hypothetical protein
VQTIFTALGAFEQLAREKERKRAREREISRIIILTEKKLLANNKLNFLKKKESEREREREMKDNNYVFK